MNSDRFRCQSQSLRVLSLFLIYLGFLCFVTANLNPQLVQEASIVQRIIFPGECTDGNGNIRGHLENWTTYDGSCDLRLCYHGGGDDTKWEINYDCPEEFEHLLDGGNCYYRYDTTLDFPQCCGYMVCDTATIPPTTTPVCYDESPTETCEIWKNMTDCVYDPSILNPDIYNYTVEFCQLTCGFC